MKQARLLSAVMCCPGLAVHTRPCAGLDGHNRASFVTCRTSVSDCDALPVLCTACSWSQRQGSRQTRVCCARRRRRRAQCAPDAAAAAARRARRPCDNGGARRRGAGQQARLLADLHRHLALRRPRVRQPVQGARRGAAALGCTASGVSAAVRRGGVSTCTFADPAARRRPCALSWAAATLARWALRARAAAGAPEGRRAPRPEAYLRPAAAACDAAPCCARGAAWRLGPRGWPAVAHSRLTAAERRKLHRLLELERPLGLLHCGQHGQPAPGSPHAPCAQVAGVLVLHGETLRPVRVMAFGDLLAEPEGIAFANGYVHVAGCARLTPRAPERARALRSRRCRVPGWPTSGLWSQAVWGASFQSCLAACASAQGPLNSLIGHWSGGSRIASMVGAARASGASPVPPAGTRDAAGRRAQGQPQRGGALAADCAQRRAGPGQPRPDTRLPR